MDIEIMQRQLNELIAWKRRHEPMLDAMRPEWERHVEARASAEADKDELEGASEAEYAARQAQADAETRAQQLVGSPAVSSGEPVVVDGDAPLPVEEAGRGSEVLEDMSDAPAGEQTAEPQAEDPHPEERSEPQAETDEHKAEDPSL